jgi:hypothetical protein
VPTLNIDTEEIEKAWLVCFGDDEGWHPSLAAGLFFSYAKADEYAKARVAEEGHPEWCILRVLPFEIKVVNDFSDPENPPKGPRRG